MSTITELNPGPPALTEAGVSVWPDLDSAAIYEHIAIRDVRLAADVLAEVHRSIMGYLPPSDELDKVVAELRSAIRGLTGAATAFGYGPRLQHSTAGYSFGTLIAAQAASDERTLRGHGLPVERVEVQGDRAEAVRALTERITAILQES